MVKRGTPAEAVRHAVDQTFQAAAGQALTTRDRAQELVDELAHTAGRLRGALEELRPGGADDLRALRSALEGVERRVSALEEKIAALPGGPRSSSARQSSATRRTTAVRRAAAARRAQPPRQASGQTRSGTQAKARGASKPGGQAKPGPGAKRQGPARRSARGGPRSGGTSGG